ncbi:MAG: hypothetical protein AAGN46_01380 [Acidobacteriota bacterium]
MRRSQIFTTALLFLALTLAGTVGAAESDAPADSPTVLQTVCDIVGLGEICGTAAQAQQAPGGGEGGGPMVDPNG